MLEQCLETGRVFVQGTEGCQPATRAVRRSAGAKRAATKRREPSRQPLQPLPPLPEEDEEVAEPQAPTESRAGGAAPRTSAQQTVVSGARAMPSLCSAATLLPLL